MNNLPLVAHLFSDSHFVSLKLSFLRTFPRSRVSCLLSIFSTVLPCCFFSGRGWWLCSRPLELLSHQDWSSRGFDDALQIFQWGWPVVIFLLLSAGRFYVQEKPLGPPRFRFWLSLCDHILLAEAFFDNFLCITLKYNTKIIYKQFTFI